MYLGKARDKIYSKKKDFARKAEIFFSGSLSLVKYAILIRFSFSFFFQIKFRHWLVQKLFSDLGKLIKRTKNKML